MHPQQQQMLPRPVVIGQNSATGGPTHYYVDPAGRPISVASWHGPGMVQNGHYTPAQMQQIQQQQAQRVQQQQLTPQQQQQYQQTLQQHYAQQQQAAAVQQYQIQQQQMAQRAAHTATAQPPQSLMTGNSNIAQSPALLQVPEPSKRSGSAVASRSASPIPPHMRPPMSGDSKPMHPSASAMASTGQQPHILPHRASTLPTSSAEPTYMKSTSFPGVVNDDQSHRTSIPIKQDADSVTTKPSVISHTPHRKKFDVATAIVQAKERESTTERLQRHILAAQARLEAIQKEDEEARKALASYKGRSRDGNRKRDDEYKAKFNNYILD
jgi:hypothetical protein